MLNAKRKGTIMVRVARREGYIGGRVSVKLQNQLTKWADDCLKSKTDIVEFLVKRFLEDEEIQKEFKKEYCDNGC